MACSQYVVAIALSLAAWADRALDRELSPSRAAVARIRESWGWPRTWMGAGSAYTSQRRLGEHHVSGGWPNPAGLCMYLIPAQTLGRCIAIVIASIPHDSHAQSHRPSHPALRSH